MWEDQALLADGSGRLKDYEGYGGVQRAHRFLLKLMIHTFVSPKLCCIFSPLCVNLLINGIIL